MIAGIKKCIDKGDITGLRYIFLDSLDVDPTFEKYKDDYVVCKKQDGMFEPYVELTPLSTSRSDWNMDYWVKIKFDQKKNFSEKRFEHMIEVAKVVYAKKIERLLAERADKQKKIEEQKISKAISEPVQQSNVEEPDQRKTGNIVQTQNIGSESNSSDLDEIGVTGNNIGSHDYQKEKREQLRAKHPEPYTKETQEDSSAKKLVGIVAIIVVIVAIVVLIIRIL